MVLIIFPLIKVHFVEHGNPVFYTGSQTQGLKSQQPISWPENLGESDPGITHSLRAYLYEY